MKSNNKVQTQISYLCILAPRACDFFDYAQITPSFFNAHTYFLLFFLNTPFLCVDAIYCGQAVVDAIYFLFFGSGRSLYLNVLVFFI